MTEVDVQTKISNFWTAKCKFLTEEENEHLERILEEIAQGKFINPCDGQPVDAIRFASWLDTKNLEEFFRRAYPYFEIVRDRLPPRIRFFAFMCFSQVNTIAEAYREFCKFPERNARMLGFEKLPTYELLREFINERIGVERFEELHDLIITEVCKELKRRGLVLGRRVGQDATDVRSLKYDKEADYSGYYKEYGYKIDIVHDMDMNLHLHYTPMHINEHEGKNLLSAQTHLRALGCKPEEWKVDGDYPSYENIAGSELNGISLKYKIQEGWVHNPAGEEKEIKRLYQKYHNDPHFRPGAEIEEQLKFLHKKGEVEAVGAYFRNKRMELARNNPVIVAKEMGERSGKTEGIIGTTKTRTILDMRPSRRGWKEFVRICGLTFLASAFAALIRVQHGILENLGSLTGIT